MRRDVDVEMIIDEKIYDLDIYVEIKYYDEFSDI